MLGLQWWKVESRDAISWASEHGNPEDFNVLIKSTPWQKKRGAFFHYIPPSRELRRSANQLGSLNKGDAHWYCYAILDDRGVTALVVLCLYIMFTIKIDHLFCWNSLFGMSSHFFFFFLNENEQSSTIKIKTAQKKKKKLNQYPKHRQKSVPS